MRLILSAFASFTLLLALSAPVSAQIELSFYGGSQSSPHSRVSGAYPGTGANYSGLIGWKGKSLAPPPITVRAQLGGVALPHVDVISSNGHKSFGYQLTGPAARLTAGMKYDLTDSWALFGEYQFTYSANKAKLPAGGTLKTNILTNAINVGVSFSF